MLYTLIEEKDFPEYKGKGLWYRHRSGCQVFHLHNHNPENLFAFCFATPPPDSTGVAHILEHTVLCGSANFPLSDPFLHLLKGSVHSFLNAMTFPDRTIYPAASALPKDLFNIMQVYGDAVFAPLLKEQMFEQEGHRLLVTPEGTLAIGGVVYNEMRGISATQEYVEEEWILRGLLPDTPYKHASGGDPVEIPTLTYQQFSAFYRQYYHPSVARIFLYGNIPTSRYLKYIHRTFLKDVSPRTATPVEIASQPYWNKPRTLVKTYPSNDGKGTLTLCWRLSQIQDGFDILCAEALSALLIETPATPLYIALVNSQLGEDISSNSGVECEVQEVLFSVGIRGAAPGSMPKFEKVVVNTLEKIVDRGIDPNLLAGVLIQMDISQREIRSLEGLRVLRRAMPGWMYRHNPTTTLSAVEAIDTLRARLAQNPRFFEERIQQWLLNNTHRLSLTVMPDSEQTQREEQQRTAMLQARLKALSKDDISHLKARESHHTQMIEQPEDPSLIDSLPHLKLKDMPTQPRTIDWTQHLIGDTNIEYAVLNRHTNDIIYWHVAFDIQLSADKYKYLPILSAILTEGGVEGIPYDIFARDIAKVGSISASLHLKHNVDNPAQYVVRLLFSVKSLHSTFDAIVALLHTMLTKADFDSARLAQLVKEQSNSTRANLIPKAHLFASSAAVASLVPSGWIQEQWNGISQLFFLLDQDINALQKELITIHSHIMKNGISESVFCGDESFQQKVEEATLKTSQVLAGQFGTASAASTKASPVSRTLEAGQSYLIPSGGNYVAMAIPATPFCKDTAQQFISESVLCRLLSTSVLWEQVRMKGGAYGVGAGYANDEGVVHLLSYRDPKVAETYQTYRTVLEEASGTPCSPKELERTLVTLSGKECDALTPAQESVVVLGRMLSGVDDALRARMHTMMLRCTPAQLQSAAQRLCGAIDKAGYAVVGEENTIMAANYPQLKAHITPLPL